MKVLRGSVIPGVAVGLGVVGAGLWYAFDDSPPRDSWSAPASGAAAAPLPGSTEESPLVQGRVLEVIDVPKYTLLRLADGRQPERWAAVSTASVKVGDIATIDDATEMKAFTSATLKRTFDSIWFGTLRSPTDPQGSPTDPGGTANGPIAEDSSAEVTAEEPPMPAHHRSPLEGGDDVAVGPVAPAAGPLGRRIDALYAERAKLAGQKVRVRGVVVKSMAGILGQTFVHIRDGSGDRTLGTHDLTVTTQADPRVGDTVLFEGTVAVDKSFGSGFTYPALLDGARLVTD